LNPIQDGISGSGNSLGQFAGIAFTDRRIV
jgi:hypothetical protein